MSELSIMQLWKGYQSLLIDDVRVVDQVMAHELSRYLSQTIRHDWPRSQQVMQFSQRCREMYEKLFAIAHREDVAIISAPEEIRPYANFIAFGTAHFLERKLKIGLWQFMDLVKAELTRKREVIEQRLVAIEKHSAPTNTWVDTRIRRMVDAFVDNWFDNYKRYRRLDSLELENVRAQLEDAAIEGFRDGTLAVMKDSKAILQHTLEGMESRIGWLSSEFELSPQVIQRLIVDIFLGILDAGEKLAAELANTKFWTKTEEAISEAISAVCHRQVELLETYSWSYQSRKEDYHLSIIQFDPEANLCFSIIMRAKEPHWRGKIRELAKEEGIAPWRVYALKQQLGL